ncbi:MAG: Zn-dependent alcohol dehydrogenase [Dehalococcoidales bacterium]|nr:Zn-dependent alcohol dehydrogenase [Dehalococcoidales bacterium]
MKAAVCYEFGKPLVIEEVDLAPPKKTEVKVKVAVVAICHSDIHDMKGELPGTVPFVGGHEVAGYVEETGPDVTTVKTGDTVVVSLLKSCGKCHFCVTGLPHLCNGFGPPSQEVRITTKKGQPLAIKGGVGGFAEYVVVDESSLSVIPKDMSVESAALLACGVISGWGAVVNRAKVRPFNSVVVIGTGGVGLNAIQGAAYSGAYPVIAVDVLDNKLKAAMDFGATHTVNSKQVNPIEEVKKLTSGRGAEYVFVTVGSVPAILQGFDMCGPRGTTVMVGLPSIKDSLTMMPMSFIRSERTLCGGFMGSTNLKEDIPNLIRLYQKGVLKLDELITGRYPLEKINEAVASVERGEALRNIIVMDQ